ncbi:O-methyltransferase [Brackiella oedipodis]|uniref:O-methyltransferase n=1 Tax=Brackiella oedipodis TaxID=124225 RepID=UPI00056F51F7|nr:O-methyltransferase [Brackiella oedipodis]
MQSQAHSKSAGVIQEELTAEVDDYFEDLFIDEDSLPQQLLKRCAHAEIPNIQVSPNQGKLLAFLVRISGAKRVLEVGTLAGYSTAWMATALPNDGKIITLEMKAEYAQLAEENFTVLGLSPKIQLIQGAAQESLKTLVQQAPDPFDFVFLDADKASNSTYLEYVLQMSRPGTIIFADNMVRRGKIVKQSNQAANIVGTRDYLQRISRSPLLDSLALQLVGRKTWDGFALSIVK